MWAGSACFGAIAWRPCKKAHEYGIVALFLGVILADQSSILTK
jgi:hypothetical protein